jgi:hypothetical protein
VLRLARQLKDAEYLLATANGLLPSVALSDYHVPFTYLGSLSRLRRDQGHVAEAELLFQQALLFASRPK